jgi:hypothetical protein
MGKKRSIAAAYPLMTGRRRGFAGRDSGESRSGRSEHEKGECAAKEKREEYQRRKEEAQEALSLSTEKKGGF